MTPHLGGVALVFLLWLTAPVALLCTVKIILARDVHAILRIYVGACAALASLLSGVLAVWLTPHVFGQSFW